MRSSSAVLAGALYFAIVFAAGFALGALRTLFIAPAVGETGAVLLEIPLMLAMAWLACGWVLSRIEVGSRPAQRLLMGATALALLLAAEAALSVLLFGNALVEHFQGYARPSALIGLAAQLAYAAFPLVRHPGAAGSRSG
jgi:ABC-type uncharacterized transport system permease subunit